MSEGDQAGQPAQHTHTHTHSHNKEHLSVPRCNSDLRPMLPRMLNLTVDTSCAPWSQLRLGGVYAFSTEPDADGYLSPGECVDVPLWLQNLRDGSVPLDLRDDWKETFLQELRDVFAEMVERKVGVPF